MRLAARMILALDRAQQQVERLQRHVLAQADEIVRLRAHIAELEMQAQVAEASRGRTVVASQDLLTRLADEHVRLLTVEALVRTGEPSRWQPPADRGRWEERAKALGLEGKRR